MATLTLGKSVTIDAVQSKKGDAVFVERRRRVVAPNSNELREEPKAPIATPKNAADEKLRAVLAAAKAREEERKAREAAEAEAAAKRAAEIEREEREYEQVREQLAARENTTPVSEAEEEITPRAKPTPSAPKTFTNNAVAGANRRGRNNTDDEDTRPNKHSKKDFKKSGKISIHDIIAWKNERQDPSLSSVFPIILNET